MKTLKHSVFFSLLIALFALSPKTSSAQIQQGNLLVGGDLGNFQLGLNKGTPFSMILDPKLATFVSDNLAVGGYLKFGLQSQTGVSDLQYGAGALGRYYFNNPKLEVIKHSRFFLEATVGYQGSHTSLVGDQSINTNGLGFGFGPGFSYFITRNVAVEALLKYEGNVGFGNNPYAHDLNLGVGFQIFLPSGNVKRVVNDVKGQ